MSEEFTFMDLAESFEPFAERLDREGMTAEHICEVFATYARCKVDNARSRETVSPPETFIIPGQRIRDQGKMA
jgi:hypothetical protein